MERRPDLDSGVPMVGPYNPYIVGNVVRRNRGFFGREDILRYIADKLRTSEQNAILLSGQRRIGKTSILHEIGKRFGQPQFVTIYFDLMDKAQWSPCKVLDALRDRIADAVGITEPLTDYLLDTERALDHFRTMFLPMVFERMAPQSRLLLLFDEFDVLDAARAESLRSTAAEQFFPCLRELMSEERRLAFVFVIGRNPNDLTLDAMSTFKTSLNRRVSVLEERDALALIRAAEETGSLSYTPSAIARLMQLTSGHPYCLQLLCHELWSEARRDVPEDVIPIVDSEQVDAIVAQALQTGEQVFEWIWQGLPPVERVLFSAIAEATSTSPRVSTADIQTLLQESRIPLLGRELELAPDTLVRWDLLRTTESGYAFKVELLRLWIVQQRPLRKVKEELDRTGPRTEPLYQVALGFYRQGNLKVAQEQLRHVLDLHSKHFKARLLLGELLLEQEKYGEAVAQLEEAYKGDPEEARLPLVGALKKHGRQLERNYGREPLQLLPIYERALELTPDEREIHDVCLEMWQSLAERYLANEMLAEARELYKKAENTQRAEDLHRLQQGSQFLQKGQPGQALGEIGVVLAHWPECDYGVGLALQAADALRQVRQVPLPPPIWRRSMLFLLGCWLLGCLSGIGGARLLAWKRARADGNAVSAAQIADSCAPQARPPPPVELEAAPLSDAAVVPSSEQTSEQTAVSLNQERTVGQKKPSRRKTKYGFSLKEMKE